MNTEDYMDAAIAEAKKAELIDEVPIGAVIVRNHEIIARAHNLKESHQMISSHAEMLAIQQAEKKLGNWCLNDCDLYVTLEPCMMCTGAISLARIHRVYYGTDDPKTGCMESKIHVKNIPLIGVYPKEVYGGIRQEECSQLLKKFFQRKRKKAKQ